MSFNVELLDQLRRLPFISRVQYTPQGGAPEVGCDGKLHIQTPAGAFQLLVGGEQSGRSPASLNALIGWADRLTTGRNDGVILLARYVPRPTAETLIARRVNFADSVGNVHLRLGDSYNWTAVGVAEEKRISNRRIATPAKLQLLFEFVTHPESISQPVRKLGGAAGISKSRAVQLRRELIAEGLVVRRGKEFRLGAPTLILERLVTGYFQVLRPKLSLGRFRYPEKTGDSFLDRLRKEAMPSSVRYALTGGPAADLLQHYYRSIEIPLFVTPWSRLTPLQLHLLPDQDGPVQVLRAFGEVVFWREEQNHMLAPPWLIYAELLNATNPRAHEAAEEFRREFLQ